MFRRIELIRPQHKITLPDGTEELRPATKGGLMGLGNGQVFKAWLGKLRGPGCHINRSAKFYFTELGWREVGRDIIAACKRTGVQFRIIKVKEREVDVFWRDRVTGYEIAAQPRKKHKDRSTGKATSS